MALKKKTTPINNVQEERDVQIERLKKELLDLFNETSKIEKRKAEIRSQIAALKLLPFKSGDTVLCEVASGRRKEEKKCVIEIEAGIVYVRPYKNGTEELSGRHFSVSPIKGDYSSIFKRCD